MFSGLRAGCSWTRSAIPSRFLLSTGVEMNFCRVFVVGLLFALLGASPALAASFVDNSGNTIVVAKPFTRIISLYSAHTENLAELGADDQLLGISTSDDYPERVLSKQSFSYREDPEKFIAARPDLVLVRPMIVRSYPQLLDKLQQAGIVIVSLQPTTVAEIFDYWRALGILTGRTAQAEAMITTFQQELAAITSLVATIAPEQRCRVYFESIHKKMKTFAPESIAIFVLEQAGGVNVAADAERVRKTNIAAYGKERILAKAEEIDLFLAQQGRMNPVSVEIIKNEPGFAAIKAVRENRIVLVEEPLVSRPTLRMLEGVRFLAGTIYPQ
ncbi:MAG TPA: ABC transporter substrate-binding protein, partial [Deltaproteobacteria bacterium]|nr:ABC transporter substrate-binding protein [Deltaproteobacteria bacterium]